ncbi:hypothetical protein MBLNU13_g07367t2 [Cladosporium sp. NU13]
MATNGGLLRVKGTDVVDGNGQRVILKGCATGGHLNMENFITGYPGHEHEMRSALLGVLGQEKYDYFFDKFLDYFFTREDAKFLASLGLNCVRVPINHRHFMDDAKEFEIKESGFRLVDRVVEACAAEGIYTILDMHTFPGGQNQGWHSDSGIARALFWENKDLQDRGTKMWVEIAKRYAGNAWVWYKDVEQAIRNVDPDHILFLDGNSYSMDFSAFEEVLPNCVYSIHDYSNMGFPAGQPYEGTDEQIGILKRQYERKVAFMRERKVPKIWNGEFGPVYASPDEEGYERTNQQRYDLLGKQLSIYKEDQIHWSIWLYKDIGFQGMVYTNPDSAYMRLLKPFLDKKKRLGVDPWGRNDTNVKHIWEPILQHLKEEIPEQFQGKRYPFHWGLEKQINRVVRDMLMSELLTYEYASYFDNKTLEELDELGASFKLEKCLKRDGLNKILQDDAAKL